MAKVPAKLCVYVFNRNSSETIQAESLLIKYEGKLSQSPERDVTDYSDLLIGGLASVLKNIMHI